MNIKLTILCVFICQLNGYLSGQVEQCGTDYQNSELIYNDIDYLNKRKEIEKFTKQILAKNGSKEFIITDEIITIPVVFHVVYKKLEQNIDDSYLIEQIQILNEDFRRTNFDAINTPIDFADIAADCKIEFCLASTDPSGNPTNGITRTLSTIPIWYYIDVTPDIPNYANKVKSGLTGGTDPWPTDSYLNIWICNLEPGLLGYAQFPGGPTETDGVVIDYEYIGNNPAGAPHDLGRVATHEIGHWLNLYHIWGQSEDAVTGGCGFLLQILMNAEIHRNKIRLRLAAPSFHLRTTVQKVHQVLCLWIIWIIHTIVVKTCSHLIKKIECELFLNQVARDIAL